MGLFDKLLGSEAKAALKQAKDLAQSMLNEAQSKAEALQNQRSSAPSAQASSASQVRAASGDSWGDEMPAEENQFNFTGSYDQYFQSVFRAEFPQYKVLAEPNSPYRNGMKYTFMNGTQIALVVEVMTDRSVAEKVRKACKSAGIPYLRFYHDHPGWWNTRSYVVRRVGAALKTA